MVPVGMLKSIGWIFLIWLCGEQSRVLARSSCRAPTLNGGYFEPQLVTYPHGTVLAYACEGGRKPAVDGWWATTECYDGNWLTQPQCIDVNDCIPPNTPHAEFTQSPAGWYENGYVIWIKCDAGYDYKDWEATAQCVNGSWLSVPVCERKSIPFAIHIKCNPSPQNPHGVIINQPPQQDVYASDIEILYECQDGYNVVGEYKKSIFCIGGNWSVPPPCIKQIKPTPGGSTTSAGGRPAGSGHSSSGRGNTGGSPTGTGSNQPQVTTVDLCGPTPIVQGGEIVERDPRFLKYQCGSFYKRVGPEKVFCQSNGQWSTTPTCKSTYCTVDTSQYRHLIYDGVKYINNGEKLRLECVKLSHWFLDHYSEVRCNNGRLTLGKCCNWFEHKTSSC
ncbi:complement factor H-related protein 1-like [Syngnathoides biaculeatus]|uniref:complement factor H-related protein 1-like n=1 Tax=Syngnathoides biaculeatus TaxID=300417 RepID=UPI002ADDD407|nr:complement factor H-related protein 1-like [Syngnathoides biaculeatus]